MCLGRSNFPHERSGISTHRETKIEGNRAKLVFEKSFARYSQLGLSKPIDKANAILGIEFRLATFYDTSSVYGVFQCHFGISLLWKRTKDEVVPIPFLNQEVPTWSWMAYENPIDYVRVSADFTQYPEFHFDYRDIDGSRINRSLLDVQLQKITLGGPSRKQEHSWTFVQDGSDNRIGAISADQEKELGPGLEVVRIRGGRGCRRDYGGSPEETASEKVEYVIIVAPSSSDNGSNSGVNSSPLYRRLGVGVFQHGLIEPAGKKALII
ncbi:hypothetical protein K505DRAFT_421053 [Melanomma pulvis-pyrius CBS 109.77]|uniref:Uncharacterized protein n=1 Tax=Melanomma pulvis-pyrius CBS 109.77 TaxID=1314802 RepID=A0A6A6WXB4_9PLEO|nr:hypothetical protein K505DRAFT_421053 [Melanomma pulvis-pyrius CBS 109.77]